ncbi:MAG: pantoate--beta-alanine ligase [Acidimicrobiales bacterium]
MKVIESPSEFAAELDNSRVSGARIGLVPTMGALHDGHRSLIARARSECDVVAVTIFVNPTQFDDPSDHERYARPIREDLALCDNERVDVVFTPSERGMYPNWPSEPSAGMWVKGLADDWEGHWRPGHFGGVATAVAKLFATSGRCRAYFGEKDFQQLAVVREMVAEMLFPVDVVACPTVREPDGLAMSSRNSRLSPSEREAARVLNRALAAGVRAIRDGCTNPFEVSSIMSDTVRDEALVDLEYACVVDARSLSVPHELDRTSPLRLLIAARVGDVRLIDNCDGMFDEEIVLNDERTKVARCAAG